MSSVLHNRLVRHSVLGKYPLFLGLGGGLTILGLILFIGALASGEGDRAWQLFHVNWIYFTGLSAGSIAFVAVLKITNAKWAGMISRFAGASSAFLPVSFVALLLIFTVGYKSIYGPMNAELEGMQHSKALWLSHGFMFARLAIGLLVMIYAGWRLIKADLVPDMFDARDAVTGARRQLFDRWSREYDGSEQSAQEQYGKIRHYAPIFAVIYAIVMTMVAFDGMMALQPHWFSNLFGAWYFMGSYLGAHMLLALMMMYGSSHLGVNDLVSPKQRHDLGKLCFGFTVFWTYLMWAQFLVIWYGNMPEETGFVFSRLWGRWLPIGWAVGLGMFIIPFFGLLGVAPKKVKPVFGFFATISLVALWLERYLLVMPSVTALPGPYIGSPEIGPTLLFLGLYLLAYALFARTFPMIAPRLGEITLSRERSHAVVEAEYEHETPPQDYVAPELVERREKPR
ncbi:MAG TPA: hypothetical protein VID04_08155 [Methylomirabilota bacterium]